MSRKAKDQAMGEEAVDEYREYDTSEFEPDPVPFVDDDVGDDVVGAAKDEAKLSPEEAFGSDQNDEDSDEGDDESTDADKADDDDSEDKDGEESDDDQATPDKELLLVLLHAALCPKIATEPQP